MAALPPVNITPGGGGPGTFGSQQTQRTLAFFLPHRRSIGGIVAQVTIDEQASDDIQITEHPVEQGAPIADHAFKRPANVTIRAGWSRQYAWDLSAETGVYGLLLSWQAALLPFDVYTGKRSYTNMLIERLQVTTDSHSEYALMATISCRQVILVSTSTAEVPGLSDSANQQSDPSQTGAETNGGSKQPNQTGTSGANVTGGVTTGEQFGPPNTDAASYDTPTAKAVNNQMNVDYMQMPNDPPVQTPTTNPYANEPMGDPLGALL